MKKSFIRAISLTVALVFLLMGAVACKKGEEEQQTAPTVTVSTDDGPKSKVPADLHFGGEAEVTMILPKLCELEFMATDSTQKIDEAVINRNLMVQERLGIKFVYNLRDENAAGAYQNIIRNTILGGEESLDIIAGNAYYTATLASEALLYDVNTQDEKNYISSDLEWYNQSFSKSTAYKNKLYFLVGDVTLGATDRAPVTFFNEDLLETHKISERIEGDLYQQAIDGKWTIEYMKTLIKDVHEERDNEEGLTKGDVSGLVFNGGSMCVDAMLYAVGIRITETDAEGKISVAWGNGTAADAYAAIYSLMYETSGVYLGTTTAETYYSDSNYGDGYYSEQAFFEKRTVFTFGKLDAAKKFATDTDLHYGMLPLPKYSEDQDYATTPQDGYTVVGIPVNIADRLQIATAALETLSEYSYKVVRPVYYDFAYKVRFASSLNTARLFDDIIDSISYDFGSFYSNSLGNPLHKLRNRLTGTGTLANSNITGVTNVYTGSVKKQIEQLLTKFDSAGQPQA